MRIFASSAPTMRSKTATKLPSCRPLPADKKRDERRLVRGCCSKKKRVAQALLPVPASFRGLQAQARVPAPHNSLELLVVRSQQSHLGDAGVMGCVYQLGDILKIDFRVPFHKCNLVHSPEIDVFQ